LTDKLPRHVKTGLSVNNCRPNETCDVQSIESLSTTIYQGYDSKHTTLSALVWLKTKQTKKLGKFQNWMQKLGKEH